ncbi:hypothetical protein EMIT0P74_30225 [Pseudomonas sp. IT-P74]
MKCNPLWERACSRCDLSVGERELAQKLHPTAIRRFSDTGLWRIGCVAWFCCWPYWQLVAA